MRLPEPGEERMERWWNGVQELFAQEHAIFWAHLSRFNSLLMVLNVSMFFLTGLVSQGYYYTCYSLVALGCVGGGMLIPTRLVCDLRYYCFYLVMEGGGIYFLVASIVFRLNHPGA